jgi:pimeloyl-ACP methyl ester carboxylesterase
MRAVFGLVLAIVVVAGCAAKLHDPDVATLLDIGDGRALFLNCQGTGSPMVLIIPGKGSYAEVWNVVVPADDPIRLSPYDMVGQANLQRSPTATQPTVAKTTRVCAYDRPNTRSDGTDRTTPVPQPHSVQQDVDDVVKLIAAAHLPAPLVVVAHSYGGLIADLLARTQPELVSGLVFVDPTSEFLRGWVDPNKTPSSIARRERRRPSPTVRASSPSTHTPASRWRHRCRRCPRVCSVRTSPRRRRTAGPTTTPSSNFIKPTASWPKPWRRRM